jgi:hypothetical protein
MTLDAVRPELDVADVIERVVRSPFLRAERREQLVCLRSTLTDLVFAVVDIAERELTVDVPVDLARTLLDRHAGLRPTERGVCLELRDDASLRTAETVLRWRIGLQLYARQARAASP